MIPALLDVVLPAFLVVFTGVLLGAAFRPDPMPINRVALYATLPALVFTSLLDMPLVLADVALLVGANALYLLVMALVAWGATLRLPRVQRTGLVATSMFGNSANLMLPITLFAFGEAGLQRALILYVFSVLTLFTIGPLVLAAPRRHGDGGPGRVDLGRRLRGVARLPPLWAAALGVAFNLLELPVPTGVSRGLELLGDAAIPLVLLTLGLQVQRRGLRPPTGVHLMGSGLKLLVGPCVGYLTGRLVGAGDLDLAVLTLLGAMPPAVNTFMLALEFGGDAEEVAGTVIVSTALSLVTVAAVVALLQAGLPSG